MKIFMFIGALDTGGAQRVTALLAKYWAGLGHEVVLVTMRSTAHDFYAITSDVEFPDFNGHLSKHA